MTYRGLNSRSCTQTVAIWRWSDSAWQQLDSRAVGTTEVTIADLAPGGRRRRLRSAMGEVARARALHDDGEWNFFPSGEVMRIRLAGGP